MMAAQPCVLNASDCRFEVVKMEAFLSRDLTPIKKKKIGPHSRLLISDPSRAGPGSLPARSRCPRCPALSERLRSRVGATAWKQG